MGLWGVEQSCVAISLRYSWDILQPATSILWCYCSLMESFLSSSGPYFKVQACS